MHLRECHLFSLILLLWISFYNNIGFPILNYSDYFDDGYSSFAWIVRSGGIVTIIHM